MSDWPIFVPDLVVAAGVTLVAYVLGRRLTTRLSFASPGEAVAVSVPLGLGTLATGVFALGLAGLFRPAGLAAALLAAALASRAVWRQWPRQVADAARRSRRRRPPGSAVVVGLLLMLVSLPLLALSLYPPIPSDATSFHLAVPKTQLAAGRVAPTPFLRYPVFPLLHEMLFALGVAFSGDIAAQVLECLLLLLTALLLFEWGRRLGSEVAGAAAAGLWLGNPLVVRFGTVAFVDVGLALFVAAAAYALGRAGATGPGWMAVAGVLTGFAAGLKYSALFFAGLFGLVACWRAARGRQWRILAAFAGPAALAATPWYAYNAVHTGNPVFPFFGGVLGYGPWTAEDLAGQLEEMSRYGLGRTVGALLWLPWNLLSHPEAFHMEARFSPFLGLLPLAVLPVVALPAARGPALFAAAYLLFWFRSVQVARYLLPLLPLVSLLISLGLDSARRWLPLPPHRGLRQAVAIGLFTVLAWPGWSFAVERLFHLGRLPTTVGERDAYLARWSPSYAAYGLLNHRNGRGYRLYQLYDEGMAYFADGTFMGDWFGPARYSRITATLHDSRGLHRELTGLGADHFLVWLNRYGGNESLPSDGFFRDHFRLLYANGAIRLYQIER